MKKIWLLFSLVLSLYACTAAVPDNPAVSREAISSRIDHLMLRTDKVDSLYNMFTNEFDLPSAWGVTDYGPYKSGGVYFGNTTIEFITFKNETYSSLHGIAFEPYSSAAKSYLQLQLAQIDCGTVTDEGYWSVVPINGYFDQVGEVFICDYDWDNTLAQNQLSQTLIANSGGLIGLLEIKEVVIQTTNTAVSIDQWNNLFYPETNIGLTWINSAGPDVTLVSGPQVKILKLVLKVSSITAASNTLLAHQMLRISNGMLFITNTNLNEMLLEVVE